MDPEDNITIYLPDPPPTTLDQHTSLSYSEASKIENICLVKCNAALGKHFSVTMGQKLLKVRGSAGVRVRGCGRLSWYWAGTGLELPAPNLGTGQAAAAPTRHQPSPSAHQPSPSANRPSPSAHQPSLSANRPNQQPTNPAYQPTNLGHHFHVKRACVLIGQIDQK